MSDYLNNIVLRSLSVADVVQPRVPHLFEQAAAAAMPVEVAPGPPGESPEETMGVAGEVHRTSDAPTPPAQVNQEVTTPFFEQFRPAPVAHTVAPPVTPVLYEASTPVPEVTNRNAEPDAVNESATRARLNTELTPVTQQRRTVNHNDDRVAGAMVPPWVGPVSKPSVAVRRSDPVTPNTRHASVPQAITPARPQHNRVEEQLPPIRINIGRVDVRAIMPAAAPVVSHSARPKPAMSLESYLKQREEGKR